jgi:hypothetical protein
LGAPQEDLEEEDDVVAETTDELIFGLFDENLDNAL